MKLLNVAVKTFLYQAKLIFLSLRSLSTFIRLLEHNRGLSSLEDDELLKNLKWSVGISRILHIMSAQLMFA